MKKSLLILCVIAAFCSLLTACHTIQGAGEDIQSGGKAIQRAAS